MHDVVAQRRNFAVFLRRKSLQHGVARMDDEDLAAGGRDGADEVADEAVIFAVVEPDPVLDRHRNRNRIAHGLDAVRDERGLRHQAGAEAARLHAFGRAAAVEVDLVVAPALAQLRAGGELRGIAAAQLQRQRMLGGIEIEVMRDVAVRERAARDHLGVEPRARRDEAQEVPAVAVGPVHHRRDAETMQGFHLADVLRIRSNPLRSERKMIVSGAWHGSACQTTARPTHGGPWPNSRGKSGHLRRTHKVYPARAPCGARSRLRAVKSDQEHREPVALDDGADRERQHTCLHNPHRATRAVDRTDCHVQVECASDQVDEAQHRIDPR